MENIIYAKYLKALNDICSTLMEEQTSGYTGERNSKGEPHGYGVMLYDDTDRDESIKRKKYEGNWKNGLRDGQGTLTWMNGQKYDGGWKDDRIHGQGKIEYANGAKYDGGWKESVPYGKGKGIHLYDNGDMYNGELKDDKKHGKGKYTWSNGKIYEGEWKECEQHGNGKEISAEGEVVYDGEWIKGEKVGSAKGKINIGDEIYEGEIKDGKPHGKGCTFFDDGKIKFDCEWKNGKKNGEGIEYRRHDGSILFQGTFKNDNYSFGKEVTDIISEGEFGEFEGEIWLKNGTQRRNGDDAINFDVEVSNFKYIKGRLLHGDDSGKYFDGDLTGYVNDWPEPYSGYSNGFNRIFGEMKNGNIEGWAKLDISNSMGVEFNFGKYGKVKVIEGYFKKKYNLFWPDGNCKVTVENGSTYDGIGDGEGSLKIYH